MNLLELTDRTYELSAEADKMWAVSNSLYNKFFEIDGSVRENEGLIIANFGTSRLLFNVLSDYIVKVKQQSAEISKYTENLHEQIKEWQEK